MEIITFKSEKKIEEVAEDITLATNMIVLASSNLRTYCNIGKDHKELSKIRTDVFNQAKLYHNKIVPFSSVTVHSIKTFCSETIENSYDDFKDSLPVIIIEADINVKLCDYSVLFHSAILTEFKKIEDEVIRLSEKQGLNYKKDFEVNNNLMSSLVGKQIEDSSEIAGKKPLTDSIQYYVESLGKIAGFFYVLFTDLATLNDNLNKDYRDPAGQIYYKKIKNQAKNIIDACTKYAAKVPNCKSNIDCISEDYDKTYVNEWLLKVVKDADKYDDFNKLANANTLIRRDCGITIN